MGDSVAGGAGKDGSEAGRAAGGLKGQGPGFLTQPNRFLFFTGKGGMGKTSLSTATALALADAGHQVLLVSTDAASNLDEMLGIALRNTAVPVPGAPGLSVLNIEPDNATESYRLRVLGKMDAGSSEAERATVREQLSGACTTEIAAFDEFCALLGPETRTFDHLVFDTAPTGHTLRLLSLPQAWSGFLGGGHGAGRVITPLMRPQDASCTRIILVTLPEATPVSQAAALPQDLRRASIEPWAWVLNKSLLAAGTHDPLLAARLAGEHRQVARLTDAGPTGSPSQVLARRLYALPWQAVPPVGLSALAQRVSPPSLAPTQAIQATAKAQA